MDGYSDYSEVEQDKDASKGQSLLPKICICCGITSVLSVWVAVIGAGAYIGPKFVEKHLRHEQNISTCNQAYCDLGDGPMLTPANMTRYIKHPPCLQEDVLVEMEKFNAAHDWKLVTFLSSKQLATADQKTIEVSAWWLPAGSSSAPRIVVQHGNNVNANDITVQLAAYLLRSIGFSVLLPNFRDHGFSQNANNYITWGWDYYLDLLGAWQYAVDDPDGALGGKLDKSKVGILGFSMGGFVTSTLFGLETGIPGVWIDSGVFDPADELQYRIGTSLSPLVAPLLIGSSWNFAERTAGVDLSFETPAKTLSKVPKGPKRRPIAVAHNLKDGAVPVSQSEDLIALLDSQNDLYDLRTTFILDFECGGNHAILLAWRPAQYRAKLCEFWTGVFGLSIEDCGLASLPPLPDGTNEVVM